MDEEEDSKEPYPLPCSYYFLYFNRILIVRIFSLFVKQNNFGKKLKNINGLETVINSVGIPSDISIWEHSIK